MKILIAEDEALSREMLQLALHNFGRCVAVVNGQEAYAAFVRSHEDNEPYQLVCLDVVMPVVNGVETLKKIRNYEKSLGILPKFQAKIVMITAMGDPINVMNSFASLCDGYLVKPTCVPEIMALLLKLNILNEESPAEVCQL